MNCRVSILIATLAFAAENYGANTGQDQSNNPDTKQPLFLPVGPSEYSSDFQYNVNFLEPQFQYPSMGGFNYIPHKQPSFPRAQPPLIFLSGAPPGQQFLLQQPGAPPGNFLIPQPEGPFLRGNPNQQNPILIAGYPKPAHVPPIEKDAEEIPSLAGNHPVTAGPRFLGRRPEKLESLDEPQTPTEADDLAPADKNSSGFPKKFPAPQPRLQPGQRFFILNGHPLYSNYPLEPQLQQPYQPSRVPQSDVVLVRAQPQFVPVPQHQQPNQVPIQDFFLRNTVTGEISDVRALPASAFDQGNIIALNQPDDFRQQGFFLRNTIPAALVQESKSAKSAQTRLGKALTSQPRFIPVGHFLPAYGDGYYFSDLRNTKDDDDDDTVVIDAKTQDEVSTGSEAIKPPLQKEDEPSFSQAEPTAVAVAGKGGVASADPRGTALVGPKGLAVSSPHATAVAGPKKEEEEPEKKPKPKKEKQ